MGRALRRLLPCWRIAIHTPAAVMKRAPVAQLEEQSSSSRPGAGSSPAGGAKTFVVPFEPTEAMWGGLARDIMMWLDMPRKTPRILFQYLEDIGRPVPQWLRDEPEMQNLDHVPSKGTRVVIIYKAMLAASEAK